jgi:transposase InsO family protein
VPGEQPVVSPDLIGRDCTAAAPGTRLAGDITYLRTGEGWLYLATVTGLATKMVTGWQLAGHMRGVLGDQDRVLAAWCEMPGGGQYPAGLAAARVDRRA